MDEVASHGADVRSDHSFVLSTIKLQLRTAKRKDLIIRPPPIDVQKLRYVNIKKEFRIEVKNTFSVLVEQQDVDMQDFNLEISNKCL